MFSIARWHVILMQCPAVLALLFMLGAADAQAACRIGRFEFDIGKNTEATVSLQAGDACSSRLDIPGLQIKSIAVPTQPKNGHLNIEGAQWKYIPHAYFRGQDSFVIQIQGTDQRRKSGTAKISFSVTVL